MKYDGNNFSILIFLLICLGFILGVGSMRINELYKIVPRAADYDFPCRQWKGTHQTFKYFEIEGRKYIICGSCGDRILLK